MVPEKRMFRNRKWRGKKLLEQDFVMKVPTEELDHSQPEWYLPLQAVFTPENH